MIKGMHGLFFAPEAEAARSFIRDKLGFANIDSGDGWLIFKVPEAELGIHPGNDTHHEISFWCDDIGETVEALQGKGVIFKTPIEDRGFGLVTTFELPGGVDVQLYEPKHAQP